MAEKVLCVRPSCFEYNEDTATSNSFQKKDGLSSSSESQVLALAEFDDMMRKLEAKGVEVVIVQDESKGCDVQTPDSIFPNNWFSTHVEINDKNQECKTLVLYPMCGINRRAERQIRGCQFLRKAAERVIDYTEYEGKQQFLEGTGSMVLDHKNRVCYAALSPRTNDTLVKRFCEDLNYKPFTFTAHRTTNGELLYHTNVMMSIGPDWLICCLDIVTSSEERSALEASLRATGRKLILISEAQLNNFCGNVLNVWTKKGDFVTVMSETAHASFTADQLAAMGDLIVVRIPTIEKYGGGSARCMLAELFYS